MKSIAVAMAVGPHHDKIGYLSNVLYSLKNQNGFSDFNVKLCIFNDGANEKELWDVLDDFFAKKDIIYGSGCSGGFQLLASCLGELIPDETQVVAYQSADTIWYDRNILKDIMESLEKEDIILSTNTQNYKVDKNLYKNCSKDPMDFQSELNHILRNSSLRSGHEKPSIYLYLGAMRAKTFKLYSKEPFICDVIQHIFFKKNNLEFRNIGNISIHQEHEALPFPCSSIFDCEARHPEGASQCTRKTNPDLRKISEAAAKDKFISKLTKQYSL
jgi:hypothetical protein